MSKIAFTPNASGTGTFTIASPDSNTSRTITLPDADGEISLGGTPVGTLIYFAASTPPTGFLKANGAAVSRTTYADLFAVIGTTWGVGDGSTTFNLPDLRGEFIRGWDDARGVDSGRALGSAQLDQMQRITGDANSSDLGGFIRSGQGTVSGALTKGSAMAHGLQGTSGFQSTKLGFDSASSPNARTSATTDGETRPRNIAALACIKY